MNILSILKTVGAAALSTHPLGVVAIPLINALLPADKKLSNNMTGIDAEKAINTMPLDEQKQILLAEIDLDIAKEKGQTARYEAMCKADGQVTRAKMAMRAMNWLIVLSVLFITGVVWVYVNKGAKAAFSYEMALVFLTVSGTFTYVVRSYFGDLRNETTSRHAITDNKPHSPKGLAGLINAIKGR